MKLKPNSEDAEQQALFQYASCQIAPEWQLMFAIPNGGKRNMGTALKMKATGLKAGIPDIFLPVARIPYNGLFIEMKSPKGHVQKNQKEWHSSLRLQGYRVEVCYGADRAIHTINEYLNTCFGFAIALEDIPKGGSGKAELL